MIYTEQTHYPSSLSRRRSSKVSVFDEETSYRPLESMPVNAVIENRPAAVRIVAYIPGLKAEDVDVEVDGKYLIISGEVRHEAEDHEDDVMRRKKEGYFYTQTNISERFSKKFILPPNAEVKKIDAGVSKSGQLIVTVPKFDVC